MSTKFKQFVSLNGRETRSIKGGVCTDPPKDTGTTTPKPIDLPPQLPPDTAGCDRLGSTTSCGSMGGW